MQQKMLGQEIQRFRIKRGFSQEELAERSNISTLHLGYIEQGRREPKFKTLKKIADALGVRVKDIIPF